MRLHRCMFEKKYFSSNRIIDISYYLNFHLKFDLFGVKRVAVSDVLISTLKNVLYVIGYISGVLRKLFVLFSVESILLFQTSHIFIFCFFINLTNFNTLIVSHNYLYTYTKCLYTLLGYKLSFYSL